MKKIIVVYHAYMVGNRYMEMMWNQFSLLIHSGLYRASDKIFMGIIEAPDRKPLNGRDWIHDFWKFGSSKDSGRILSKIEIKFYDKNREETDTLKWIRDYAKDKPGDYVLYFHTKGISIYTPGTESWRRYMEYFVIENWKDCVSKLSEGYDCCGVMWNTDTPIGIHPHFSGNFWWANTNYINTLDHNMLDSAWRYDREFWIGSGPGVKPFEFHNSGLNNKKSLVEGKGHYDVEYPRSNYEKK